MPTYAYPWRDGSVSICAADNVEDAVVMFDTIAPTSRRLVVKLCSCILLTIRPHTEGDCKLDPQGALDIELASELEEHFYPEYARALDKGVDEDDPSVPKRSPDKRTKRLLEALERDRVRIERIQSETPETIPIVILYPGGLPGQEN